MSNTTTARTVDPADKATRLQAAADKYAAAVLVLSAARVNDTAKALRAMQSAKEELLAIAREGTEAARQAIANAHPDR